MFHHLLWILSILVCVSANTCDLVEDVLFCEGSKTLPNEINSEVKTIILDDTMMEHGLQRLKGLYNFRIIIWGNTHCSWICEDMTRDRWIHQCKCQVRIILFNRINWMF